MRESEKMEIRKLYEEGVSISELARRYGHDRKTIRKAVSEPRQQEEGMVKSRGRRSISITCRANSS